MLKTNQGTWGGVNLILRSSEYRPMRCLGRIGTTNERLRGNKNLDVSSDGKITVDFPVCHCRGEIWTGSEFPDSRDQEASNRDDDH